MTICWRYVYNKSMHLILEATLENEAGYFVLTDVAPIETYI